MKKIAIIILNYNNSKDTLECLDSLDKIIKKSFKVFLVDNSSIIEEYYYLEKKILNYNIDIQLIRSNENKGFSHGNNLALKLPEIQEYENVLLLNNDTVIIDFEIFDKILSFINDKNLQQYIIGINLLNPDYTTQPSKSVFPSLSNDIFSNLGLHSFQTKFTFDFFSGAFLFFNTSLLADIGLLDENYFLYFEEADIFYRAKQKGYRKYFIKDVNIIHKGGASTGKLNENTVQWYYQSMTHFLKKNFKYDVRLKVMYFTKITLLTMSNHLLKCIELIPLRSLQGKIENKILWNNYSLKYVKLLLQQNM